MAYKDPEVRRALDRERFHRRTEDRRARGLCPKCGKRPPEPERSLCAPCGEKRNKASRTCDARLRAAGKLRRDPAKARASDHRSYRRRVEERREAGLCIRCGQAPAMPERSMCEPCSDKRRAADRARYEAASARGAKYGGKNPAAKRRNARERSRKRDRARSEAGLCSHCGARPPVEGGATCEPCKEVRRQAERGIYAERRIAGLCVRCAGPAIDGGSRCSPCAALEAERGAPERKNVASRRRYKERRARGKCTSCGAPSQGAARCQPCADRSYERSDHFRGMPVYPPSFAVFLRDTGECLATFDDEMDVAAFLAFEKLTRDRVEVVADAPEILSYAAWS